MIGVLLVAAMVQAEAPPLDWTALPLFPLPRAAVMNDAMFVRRELAERCQLPAVAAERGEFTVPVAILVAEASRVRRITPRAVGCPTVEQYTVGYVQSLTRSGPSPGSVLAPGWYRATVTFRW